MRLPRILGASALIRSGRGAPAASAAFDLESHRGGRGLRPENTLASVRPLAAARRDDARARHGRDQGRRRRRLARAPHLDARVHRPARRQARRRTSRSSRSSSSTAARARPDVPSTDPFVGTQESVPGTKMPTLAEVFELAEPLRRQARAVQHRDQARPDAPEGDRRARRVRAQGRSPSIKKYKMTKRSLIQSFDWRTLVEARELRRRLRRVALAQKTTVFKGTPWTAGIEIGTNAVRRRLARAGGQGRPEGARPLPAASPTSPTALIKSAHNRGLTVIPWTVNEKADMRALIERGRRRHHHRLPRPPARGDGRRRTRRCPTRSRRRSTSRRHRGGRRYRPENTLAAFKYGLSRNVDTLELDTGVTKPTAWSSSRTTARSTRTTARATPRCSASRSRELTFAQIRTLDCGSKGDFAGQPGWVASPGAKMPTLQEVFDLVAAKGDTDVRFNIETKLSPTADDTVPYDVFTAKVVKSIQDAGLQDRAMIQSFDWRTIRLAKQLDPRIETVALVWQYAGADCDDICDECSLRGRDRRPVGDSARGRAGWTGGATRTSASSSRAAKADVVSSNWQVHDPTQGKVDNADYYLKEDPAIYHGPPVPTLQDTRPARRALHDQRPADDAARDRPRRRRDHLRRPRRAAAGRQAQRAALASARRRESATPLSRWRSRPGPC